MANVFLTVKRVSPNPNRDLSPNPKVTVLEGSQIFKAKVFKKGISLLYGSSRPLKRYRMAETMTEYEYARRLSDGLTTVGNQNLSASGNTQGTAQAITAYHSAVTAAQGAASGGLLLPPASTKFNNGGAFVVRNDINQSLSVYPAASEYIDSGASNAPITVAAFGRMHFTPSASNKWLSATVASGV